MNENLDLTENIEINQALKEFEIKSQIEQMQTPSFANDRAKNSDVPKMTRLVMKWFRIDQKQAEYILLGFVVVVIAISLFLFFGTTNSSKISSTQKAALDQMLQQHPDLIKK